MIALAHVISDVNCPFRGEPECFERGAAELRRRFEGLAHLIIHALGKQFEAVALIAARRAAGRWMGRGRPSSATI
jgi:hypothetical protein